MRWLHAFKLIMMVAWIWVAYDIIFTGEVDVMFSAAMAGLLALDHLADVMDDTK